MENVRWRSAGVRVYREWRADGSLATQTLTPSSLVQILRTSSGYTGKRPKLKPMPVHNYSFNVQNISLRENFSEYTYGSGTIRRITGEGPILHELIGGATIPFPDGLDGILYNRALEKLTAKVRGELDLSVDLAEAHKTAKMLNAKDQIVKYTKAFMGRNFMRGIPTKALANLWLEYTYGFKPLAQSLYGAAEENLRTVVNNMSHLSARATEKFTPKTVKISTIWGLIDIPVASGFVKRSVTLGVDMRDDQFDLARWSSLNPISIAWELAPFSFVADWFLNVGGYLRGMETYCLYANKFRGGYRTNLTVAELRLRNVAIDVPNGPGNKYSFDQEGFLSSRDIQRSLLTNYPIPQFPSLQANLGASRLISAASLLRQLLK